MVRFAAKLLFQYRVVVGGRSGKRRTCEERIIVLRANSAKNALSQAKRKGSTCERTYANSDGNPVHFEFVGVVDLLALESECDENEVWYDIRTRVLTSERKCSLIPPESRLSAIQTENGRRGDRSRRRNTAQTPPAKVAGG
jgi:hypothetical protein